ncbi:MAG: U32 family peptidase [Lachnospiraceae bacterium]|nr:U32 family peptidase [Lachnospiraceae bacterium]
MVELLAPAGEYKSFVGAISAGADAVYLAGNMYGARASAVNFTTEELIHAIRYAHLLNRKVYLTVNTLTLNSELEKLYDYLYPFYINGLDAVIVQDIGVFLYIKENFKDLDIHVSTQAAVTSVYGAEFYKNIGADRIVLARELTLNEIKEITDKGIETECFIHGAMCYSYSGMCLFSSFLGGNSGNRGRCKGPCRQPYKIDGKEAYYLSLADMNTVDIIDKLIDAGIFSFKIEGRLKSASYAAGVTSVYRKYIDMHLENPEKEIVVSKKDKELLKTLYSRASTGHGYYERTSSKKMITFEKGAYLKVDEGLEKEINEKYVENPVKKEIDFVFEACEGKKAILTATNDCLIADKKEITVYSDSLIETASKKATSQEEILKQLKKLGNTDFVLRECTIKLDNGFVPSSLVNNLRRECMAKLEESIYEKNCKREVTKPESLQLDHNAYVSPLNEKTAFVSDYSQLEILDKKNFFDNLAIPLSLIKDQRTEKFLEKTKKKIYLVLPYVLRSLNTCEFDFLLDFSDKHDKISGCFVNQYDAYRYLKEKNYSKEIRGNLSVYNCNSVSADFNASLFDGYFASSELSINEIKNVSGKGAAVLMYGRAPLMYTANCVLKTSDKCLKGNPKAGPGFVDLKDRLNVDFKVKTLCGDNLCMNIIYNSKPVSLHKYYSRLKKNGISSFAFLFTDERAEEIETITDFFEKVFEEVSPEAPFEYTAYHIKNGIL